MKRELPDIKYMQMVLSSKFNNVCFREYDKEAKLYVYNTRESNNHLYNIIGIKEVAFEKVLGYNFTSIISGADEVWRYRREKQAGYKHKMRVNSGLDEKGDKDD